MTDNDRGATDDVQAISRMRIDGYAGSMKSALGTQAARATPGSAGRGSDLTLLEG